jgi:hypothetical protein
VRSHKRKTKQAGVLHRTDGQAPAFLPLVGKFSPRARKNAFLSAKGEFLYDALSFLAKKFVNSLEKNCRL